jgi:hypothetical protein
MTKPMKSYSGKGIFDEREAKSRRKWFDSKHWRGLCRGVVRMDGGHGQLEATEEGCRMLATAEATFEYQWFDGSLEEWLDGKPFETRKVD